jgi:hypothetical protein
MPVIVGAPRSGTTLLRFMLDAHPLLAIPPETGFLALADQFGGPNARSSFFEAVTRYPPDAPAWNDFGIPLEAFSAALDRIEPFSAADGFRAMYRLYAARFGKPRWGDKTPMYALHLPVIAACLPEARFVHLIRDGRDVALSLRQTWFSPGTSMAAQAGHWLQFVSAARRDGPTTGRYLEIRYEDLVRDPRRTLEAICAFIDLPYSDEMLAYHHGTRLRLQEHGDRVRVDGTLVVSREGRLRQQAMTMQPPSAARAGVWKTGMTATERQQFEAVAGELLEELGYARGAPDRT